MEEGNSDHIDDGHEETKTECNNQDCLLLGWKTHLRQDRNREKQDGQIGNDVHGGGGKVEGNDVDALRAGGIIGEERRGEWPTLEKIDHCQSEARSIDYRQRDVVGPSKHLFVARQGQVEDEDGGFDGHERGVLPGSGQYSIELLERERLRNSHRER